MDVVLKEVEAIKKSGCKQGSILHIENEILSIHQQKLKVGFYIIISQDCDILHHSFEEEPHAEIVLCNPIDNYNGNFTHGKNPRRIQFQLGDKKYYECSIKNRFFIDRRSLVGKIPCTHLTICSEDIDNLILWITKRYKRDAFPDEFNRRIKNKKKLQKILEKHGKEIKGIFIRLNTYDELIEHETYKIELVLLIDIAAENLQIRSHFNNILEEIVKIIGKNKGLEILPNYAVRSPEEITLGDFLKLKKWDFDFLSYGNFSGETMLSLFDQQSRRDFPAFSS